MEFPMTRPCFSSIRGPPPPPRVSSQSRYFCGHSWSGQGLFSLNVLDRKNYWHLILVRLRRTEPHDEDDTAVTEKDGGLKWARAVGS